MRHSIVMPVYLREESHRGTVEATLQNLRDMSPDVELIVIDDGSPLDMSAYAQQVDVFIRFPQNQGISAAWNAGMEKATGEYIAIVNDDIKVPKRWLEKLEQGFTDKKTGVTAPMQGGPHITPSINAGSYFYSDHKFYPGYCFMLKRDRFFEPFDNQFRSNCGDTDYWHRIREAGLKCVRVGLSIWHQEGGVLHGMDYDKISKESLDLFKVKWEFDPREEYYG